MEGKLSPTSPTWDYETLAKGETTLPQPAAGQVTVPTWKDELYLEYHRGVFTTQADHKRNMRNSEEWVLDAEKYASLAWLDGQKYPADEITGAWKHVLFNQFHDLAAGSGIGIIYKDAQKDYDQVRWATNEVSTKALAALTAEVDTGTGVPVVVFNSLGWRRGGVTEVAVHMPTSGAEGVTLLDEKNRIVPSQALSTDANTNTYRLLFHLNEVPSLGYVVLHAVAGKRALTTDLKSSGTSDSRSADGLHNVAIR
jgi:alpha-mannosidase